MKRRNDSATRRTSGSNVLKEPLVVDEIFEQHGVLASFEQDLDVATSDEGAPPFVVDAPDFADRRDAASDFELMDLARQPVAPQRHGHLARDVQGSKSISA